jgi:6-phosphogluconolactonase
VSLEKDWSTMSTNYDLISFRTPEELAETAANAWLDAIDTANRMKASQDVALSGGRITQKFFASVVRQTNSRKTSLDRVQFFWADERCLPPSDPESNFKLANDLLFQPLDISENQIHRLRGEDAPETAAKAAEAEIRSKVGANAQGQPVLDIIFLGLGEDGHVASLFPSEAETWVSDKAVFRAINNSPKPPPNRITIGYQTIAAARQVWMFASGTGKEKALRDSLSPNGQTSFARVLRLRSETKILTDITV